MKYLGIDWAHRAHVAVLLGAAGRLLDRRRVPHAPDDVRAYLAWLRGQGGPGRIRIGIESGALLLLDQLLLEGYWVCVFNPRQSERCRDRLSASAAKDDARDALAVAEALRTDSAGRYRPVERDDPAVEALRLVDAARTQAVQRRVAAMNQLWALLQRYYPALLELGRPCDDPFLLDLLRAFPDPRQGREASPRRVARLLRERRVRALGARQVVAALGREGFEVPEHVAEACRLAATQLAAEIALLNDHVGELDRRTRALFARHPDREILESLPGLGPTLSARVGARLGTRRDPQTGRAHVALRGGAAPVTRRSGERRGAQGGRPGHLSVRMRRCCDRVLQTALHAMAKASLRTCAWARAYFQSQIRAGATKDMGLRALSLKWAKILDTLLLRRQTYDEAVHVAHLRRAGVPWAADLDAKREAAA